MQLKKQHRGLPMTELGIHLHETLGDTISLNNGKKIGYLEFGDPSGLPLFYFHGSVSSRLEAGIIAESAAKYGIRLIALDRPGIGLSDPIKRFSFVDWPIIVMEVADRLGIDRFSVCGASGGGAFACACGAIPNTANRVDSIALIAAMVPATATEKKHQMKIQRIMYSIAKYTPFFGKLIFHLITTKLKKGKKNDFNGLADSKDEKGIVLTKSIIKNVLYTSSISSQLQGHTGNVRDFGLYMGPLGFQLEDIEVPVFVFTGLKDQSVPSVICKRIAQQVTNGKLLAYKDDSHLTVFQHSDEICRHIKSVTSYFVENHTMIHI